MDNLNLARELLLNENLKIVVYKNNELVYKDDHFGIKPLYNAFLNYKNLMEDASCADRVIGKAAAWIYKEAKIKELYCDVITTTAKELLINNGINVKFVKEIEYVKNRDLTGMCPVETLAKDETNFDNLLNNIKSFLIEKGLL